MKILEVDCSRCGAPLEVPKKASKIECEFCGSPVRVDHSTPPADLEYSEDPRESDQVRELKRDLWRLDRRWRKEARGNGRWDSVRLHRHRRVPSTEEGFAVVVLGGLFFVGTMCAMFYFKMVEQALPLVPLSVVMMIVGKTHINRAVRHQARRAKYRRKRREVLAEMKDVGASQLRMKRR